MEKKHAKLLQQADEKYHVAPSIITAIIGIESNYGMVKPKFNARNTLFTLACLYTRRATFFTQELAALLALQKRENLKLSSINGSYAGALGMPQFMPSSYLEYAKDGDNNHHVNLFSDHADVIYSVANYLHQFGWRRHHPVIQSIAPHQNKAQTAQSNQRHKHLKGPVALATEPDVFAYYQPYANFNALLKYNQSPNYAMSVYLLAKAIYKESKPSWVMRLDGNKH